MIINSNSGTYLHRGHFTCSFPLLPCCFCRWLWYRSSKQGSPQNVCPHLSSLGLRNLSKHNEHSTREFRSGENAVAIWTDQKIKCYLFENDYPKKLFRNGEAWYSLWNFTVYKRLQDIKAYILTFVILNEIHAALYEHNVAQCNNEKMLFNRETFSCTFSFFCVKCLSDIWIANLWVRYPLIWLRSALWKIRLIQLS